MSIVLKSIVIASAKGARQSLDGHANEHSLAMTVIYLRTIGMRWLY